MATSRCIHYWNRKEQMIYEFCVSDTNWCLGDNDLLFLDFRHVIENLHAWKLVFRGFQACKFSITCRKSENTTLLSPF